MKKLSATLVLLVFASVCFAQTTWTLDFGTNTGTFVIAAAGAIESTTAQSPNLDVPSTSNTMQVVRLRKSNNSSPGGFELVNTGAIIGSGSRLKITAPNSTSSNKFSVYNIGATSKVFRAKFKLRFDAGTNGEQIFSVGNNDGGSFYSNGSGLTEQAFASVQWNLGATKHAFSFFNNTTSNNSTTAIDETLNPVIANFTPNSEHEIEMYCNNTTVATVYARSNTNYTIAPNKWQIWVNGTRLFSSNGIADFNAGVLGLEVNLNAFLFNTKSSTTAAITYLDDFNYSDFLPAAVLPVTLSSLAIQKQTNSVILKWQTASELNNDYFVVQHAVDGVNFSEIGKIKGTGNSNATTNYNFTHRNPSNGTNYYRLKQVDFDGNSTLSETAVATMALSSKNFDVYTSNKDSNIDFFYSAEKATEAKISIYSIDGRKIAEKNVVLEKGGNKFAVNVPSARNGIFIASLRAENLVLNKRFAK
jgi:hypothetical protein